jgi:uncharacterized protein (DUF885 family)
MPIAALTMLASIAGWNQSLAATQVGSWDTFVDSFVEGYFSTHPDFAVRAGRHDFDGKLPNWSSDAVTSEVERLRSARERALGFNAALLNESQRFERDYLIAVIARDLFWLEAAQWPYRNPMFYSQALDPNVYLTREYAPLAARMRAYIAYARAIPTAVEQIRKNLRTPLPRTYVDLGQKVFSGLAAYYAKDVAAVFASVKQSRLQSELRAANARAAQAMEGLAKWLAAQGATATDAFALGPALYSKMLRDTEGVDVSVDRLEKVGRADLERNLAALREACHQHSPEATIPECIAEVQAPKPKGGPVEGAGRQLHDLKAFVIAKDLVTIPGPGKVRVAESPPYHRWNLAYIDIPGPLDRRLSSVYYVAPPDPSWSKTEREAYIPGKADLLFISVHEVWPGHFLQYLHSNRSRSKLGQLFVGYGFAEGWAHYTEEMMWEAGLGNGDPKTHIGQLLNALLRNVRYLSAIGLHTRAMTVDASQRMFRELAFQDVGNAKQQAARGTFDPAYINYTLGKLMIRKLREDWTASRGGRTAWRSFHDQFLSFGGPPIPLIRAAMLGPDSGSPL